MIIKSRLLILLYGILISFHSQAQNDHVSLVEQSVNDFVTAFNNFNWETFSDAFTEDASIFHPFWKHARRVQGRNEINDVWLSFFPEFIDSKNTRKLNINPKDINIQYYQNTAIVTFHLGFEEKSISRRTLVFIRIKDTWKIAHLHASNIVNNKN